MYKSHVFYASIINIMPHYFTVILNDSFKKYPNLTLKR